MKAVSVSAELTVVERAVDAANLLLEVQRQGGVGNEDVEALASAVLALASTRLRDLGRVARGRLPVQEFVASHNEAVDRAGGEDLVLRPRRTRRPERARR